MSVLEAQLQAARGEADVYRRSVQHAKNQVRTVAHSSFFCVNVFCISDVKDGFCLMLTSVVFRVSLIDLFVTHSVVFSTTASPFKVATLQELLAGREAEHRAKAEGLVDINGKEVSERLLVRTLLSSDIGFLLCVPRVNSSSSLNQVSITKHRLHGLLRTLDATRRNELIGKCIDSRVRWPRRERSMLLLNANFVADLRTRRLGE